MSLQSELKMIIMELIALREDCWNVDNVEKLNIAINHLQAVTLYERSGS